MRRWPVVAVHGKISGMSEQATPPEHRPQPETTLESPETAAPARPKEIGGRDGPEPVRYGDWEKNGRCIDF
jgi:hypothetical protein